MGVASLNTYGQAAVLYYLGGYMFSVLGALMVICLVMRKLEDDDVTGLAAPEPALAAIRRNMTLSMVSLAGIPPLAGTLENSCCCVRSWRRALDPIYYWVLGVAIFGVVASIYYYFGVVRAIYWSRDATRPFRRSTISRLAWPTRAVRYILGMLWLGLFPSTCSAGPKRRVSARRGGEALGDNGRMRMSSGWISVNFPPHARPSPWGEGESLAAFF